MPQGRKGHIGAAKEAVFGTPVAATDYHRFRSESVITAIEEVTPPNILGVFDEGPTYQGLKTHAGDIEMDAHPNVPGLYLLSGIGDVATTNPDVGVRWVHVFSVRQTQFSDQSIMRPMTLEIHRDIGNAFQYTGFNANTLQWSWGIGAKVLAFRVGGMAKSMARIAPTVPTFESTQAFRWNQCTIRLPDPTAFLTIQDIQINVDNGLSGKAYIDGTQEIARVRTSGPRVVTFSGTMLATDAEITEFLNGSERDSQIEFIGSALGTGFFKYIFDMPKVRYTAYPVGIAGPDEVMVSFTGKAKFDSATAQTPLQVTLHNSKSSY